MKVNYTNRDPIHDRPPLLYLEPETDADQAVLDRLREDRGEIVHGWGADPATLTYTYMELRIGFEADNTVLRKKLEERGGNE